MKQRPLTLDDLMSAVAAANNNMRISSRHRQERTISMRVMAAIPFCMFVLLLQQQHVDHSVVAAWSTSHRLPSRSSSRSSSTIKITRTAGSSVLSGPLGVSRPSQRTRQRYAPTLSLVSTTANGVDTTMENTPEPCSSSSTTTSSTTALTATSSSADEAVTVGTQATLLAARQDEEEQQQQQQQPQSHQLQLQLPSFPSIAGGSNSFNWKEMLGIDDTSMDAVQLRNKAINALILTASFGFALYQILNIDHGMTRGWTQSEIAMRIPMDTWAGYESALDEKPVFTKTMINVVIYLLGDWLSQTVFQKRNVLDFDAKRTLRNGFIGLCFGPLVHAYYEFSDTILPLTDGDLWTRGEKILMDQTIYLAVKCSIYIAAVSLLQGDSVETAKDNVKGRIGGIVVTAWKFWPLVHCLTYTVIPSRHRILWVNMIDLIWNAILATMASKKLPSPEEEVVEAALAAAKVEAEGVIMIEGSSDSISNSSPLAEVMKTSGVEQQNQQQQHPLNDILVFASQQQHEEDPAELLDSLIAMDQTASDQLQNEEQETTSVLAQLVEETRAVLSIGGGPSSGNATMAAAA